MELLFYLFAIFCVYSYFLYPLLLTLISPRKIAVYEGTQNLIFPPLSLIITVHNEAERIRDKLDNTLLIDYPTDKLEIIVASDFSTDDTDTIVESYADKGIRLVRADQRLGK